LCFCRYGLWTTWPLGYDFKRKSWGGKMRGRRRRHFTFQNACLLVEVKLRAVMRPPNTHNVCCHHHKSSQLYVPIWQVSKVSSMAESATTADSDIPPPPRAPKIHERDFKLFFLCSP
jgi:hypothetical protein